MEYRLNRIFKQIDELDPPAKIAELVLNRIETEKSRLFLAELFLSRVGFAGSLLILFYALFVFGRAIIDSEFWKLASLVTSDLGAVASNWQEFFYSLLETMPVMNLIAILLPAFVLMISFNFYLKLSRYKYV